MLSLTSMPKNGKRWFCLRENYRVNEDVDHQFEEIVTTMLSKSEKERPSAEDLKILLTARKPEKMILN